VIGPTVNQLALGVNVVIVAGWSSRTWFSPGSPGDTVTRYLRTVPAAHQ
jgi:hypothetical protein